MGKSKIDFQEIIQNYNDSFIQHIKDEAMMYERLYDNRSKDIE
jgi:hypothetical protein